jgi:hypothetical protein
MAIVKDQQFKIAAADGTTATLQPISGKEHVSATQVVFTFATIPAEFTVGKIVRIRLEVS